MERYLVKPVAASSLPINSRIVYPDHPIKISLARPKVQLTSYIIFGSVLSQFTIYLKSMGSYIPRLAPWYWANPSSAKRTNECLEEDEVETFRCFSNQPLLVLGGPSLHF